MGQVEAFTLPGLKLWFNSSDHLPPHLHVKRRGDWEIRVFFLECTGNQLACEHKWGRRNTDINDERSALLYWARVWLLTVLWLTTFAGIPYVADQVRHPMPRPPSTQQPAPQATPAPQSTRPEPPPFPPNREIREGDIPRRQDTPPAR